MTREQLPESVQLSLGELAGAAREGLLALLVGVGVGVRHELMAAVVTEVCGPKGRHDSERRASRLSTGGPVGLVDPEGGSELSQASANEGWS